MTIDCEQCDNTVPLTDSDGESLCLDCYIENAQQKQRRAVAKAEFARRKKLVFGEDE